MSAAQQHEGPFDLERVRVLMELMEKHGLSEVSLRSSDEHWRFRRGPQEVVQVVGGGGGYPAYPAMAAPAPASAPSAAPAAATTSVSAPTADPHAGTVLIKSPQVGTFYAAASPDDKPYVTVGSKVTPKTVVCQVEAMKVFNQIEAEVNGTIVEVLVKNGDSVEWDQPMFRVKPG